MIRSTSLAPLALAPALLCFLTACEAQKSETPLSPSVAGPIAGVEITPPGLVEPGMGARYKESQQPVRLTVQNASTSGVRPLSYSFEVAVDPAFETRVFGRGSVVPGADGKTSVQLDRLDGGRTYYWRARAEDGANSGPFLTAQFDLLPKPVVAAPVPLAPVNNEQIGSTTATLRVRNADHNAGVGALVYEFQVAANQAFTQMTGAAHAGEGVGETAATITPALPAGAIQYWRVRVTDGETTSDWSVTQVFRTPAAAPGPPPPSSPPPGGGSGGSCASSDGPAIVACISAKFPAQLAPTHSLGERQANMEFLRDRIIEAGKCGGLNLGWNLKRGGPERSIDFLAERRPGGDMGIDIGFDYDNISNPLRLQWSEAGYGATWEAYPAVGCGGV
jgi:hypothetical protein